MRPVPSSASRPRVCRQAVRRCSSSDCRPGWPDFSRVSCQLTHRASAAPPGRSAASLYRPLIETLRQHPRILRSHRIHWLSRPPAAHPRFARKDTARREPARCLHPAKPRSSCAHTHIGLTVELPYAPVLKQRHWLRRRHARHRRITTFDIEPCTSNAAGHAGELSDAADYQLRRAHSGVGRGDGVKMATWLARRRSVRGAGLGWASAQAAGSVQLQQGGTSALHRRHTPETETSWQLTAVHPRSAAVLEYQACFARYPARS